MAKDFDPYYKWLGIPPKDQPPNHYRLLGIEVFESDRDVIDAAANRVMSYLKDMATSDELEHSQKLLNEVSRARICLLNKQQKNDYDAGLRSAMQQNAEPDDRKPAVRRPEAANGQPIAPAPAPPRQPASPPMATPVAQAASGTGPGSKPAIVAKPGVANRKRSAAPKAAVTKSPPKGLLIGLLALSALAVISVPVLLLLVLGGGEEVAAVDPDVAIGSQGGTGPGTTPSGTGDDEIGHSGTHSTGADVEPSLPPLPDLTEVDSAISQPDATSNHSPIDPADDPFQDPLVPVSLPTDDGNTASQLPTGLELDPVDPSTDLTPTFDDPTGSSFPMTGDTGAEDGSASSGTTEPVEEPSTPSVVQPFASLPSSVALPAVDELAAGESYSLGRLQLNRGVLCFIKLHGGENACKGSPAFSMLNGNGGVAPRNWDISLQQNEADTPHTVAQLSIDDVGELNFQWMPEAAADPLASQLCNCALSLSHAGQSHVLRLRAETVVVPFTVDLKKSESTDTWKLTAAPDSHAVFFELVGIDGVTSTINPPTGIAANDGQADIKIQDGGDLLNLSLTVDLGRTLKLSVRPQVLMPNDPRPIPFIFTRLNEELLKQATQIQNMQTTVRRLQKGMGQLSGAQQRLAQQQLTLMEQQQLPAAQAQITQFQELDRWIQSTEGKLSLQFRLYYNADATEVDLLRSEAEGG